MAGHYAWTAIIFSSRCEWYEDSELCSVRKQFTHCNSTKGIDCSPIMFMIFFYKTCNYNALSFSPLPTSGKVLPLSLSREKIRQFLIPHNIMYIYSKIAMKNGICGTVQGCWKTMRLQTWKVIAWKIEMASQDEELKHEDN